MRATGVDAIATVPWLPTVQRELGLEDETLVDHVRDVTVAATALGEAVSARRGVDLDLDVVRAAGLLHDVSQLAESDGWEPTPVYRPLGHPYWAVYPMERAGLPVPVQHAVLAHSPFSNVETATMEAVVVSRAEYGVAGDPGADGREPPRGPLTMSRRSIPARDRSAIPMRSCPPP